jgi:branched-chain amino acid transport system substrate-binding protein
MVYHDSGEGAASTGSESGTRFNRRTFLTAAGAGAVATTAGCLGGGGGGDGLKIGLLTPQAADVGIGAERMAQLYVDKVNEEGGIMDQEIELLVADTELSPSTANSAVQDFLQEGVNMIAGTFASETALAIIERIGQSDAMFFTGGPASTQIVQDFPGEDYEQYKNIFQMCTNSIDQARGYADYAAFLSDTHGWNEFSVMVEDAAWTENITDLTGQRMEEEHGLTVNSNTRVARDTTDWSPILDNVESDGSEVLLKALAQVPGTGMLSTWAENEYPFAQEGTNVSSMSSRYWESTNGNCLYETTGGCTTGGSAIVNDRTEEAVSMYQEAHDDHPQLPMYVGLEFIDSVRAFKLAAEEVGSIDDVDAISEEVAAMDEPGAGGRIRFYGEDSEFPNSRNKEYRVFIPQWQPDGNGGGEKVPVWPDQLADGDHMVADWL